ncbi:hypothetical protein PLICRDRAFT_385911 [Plicaturopsis crispa FD-325 SS-3]|nr:hypothetical protein PLICRDRAFT_385911 [Plicaturopsis crispa FD-325 SS-3]
MSAFYSLADTMFTSLRDVLNSRTMPTNTKPPLDTLSYDILVDHVFAYLRVEEIMAMRRVNKFYYYITHQPVIWKRFLRLMSIPLPPLPPTARYTFGRLTSLEAERLVMRAITLDDNLRASMSPRALKVQQMAVAGEVQSMCVLPGGKYLVASGRDEAAQRFPLMICILDRPTRDPIELARMFTPTQAYDVQARYMTIKGVEGITTAFLTRHLSSKDRHITGIDPANFSTMPDVGDDIPFKYKCFILHTSLAALERLGETRNLPSSWEHFMISLEENAPFRYVHVIRSALRLGKISLVNISGMPHLCAIQHPESLLFANLHNGYTAILQCKRALNYPNTENTIRAYRVLPNQNQVLVIRQVNQPDIDAGAPPGKTHYKFSPIESRRLSLLLNSHAITDFQISDPEVDLRSGFSARSSVTAKIPAISIFYHCKADTDQLERSRHCMIWPSSHPKSRPYTLQNLDLEFDYFFGNGVIPYVLPGTHRAVVYTLPRRLDAHDAPPISTIWCYNIPHRQVQVPLGPQEEWDLSGDEEAGEPQIVMRNRKPSRPQRMVKTKIPSALRSLRRQGRGVTAMAWDETIGRLCIAMEGDQRVWILDYSGSPSLSQDGQRLPVPLPHIDVEMQDQ